MSIDSKELLQAAIKKALGYVAKETAEESVVEDGQIRLIKQKTVSKEVPPDVSALKLLLEREQIETDNMTDEELEAEKQRLLQQLKRGEEE